jgi:hypothetical protein
VEHAAASLPFVHENVNDCPTDSDPSFLQSYNTVNRPYVGRIDGTYCSPVPSFEPQGLSDSYIANEHTNTQDTTSNTPASDLPQALLLQCIEEDIVARKKKGCVRFDRSIVQRGNVPCTLGCGRLFRSSCDRTRHAEIVYHQKYCACYLGRDLLNPTSRDFFIRPDKLRAHNTRDHADQLNIGFCRISNISPASPQSCGLCRHSFHGPHDRERHIASEHSGSRRRPRCPFHVLQVNLSSTEDVTPQLTRNKSELTQRYPDSYAGAASFVDFATANTAGYSDIQHDHTMPEFADTSLPSITSQAVIRFVPFLQDESNYISLFDNFPHPFEDLNVVIRRGAFADVIQCSTKPAYHLSRSSSTNRQVLTRKNMRSTGNQKARDARARMFEEELRSFRRLAQIRSKKAIVDHLGTAEHIDNEGRQCLSITMEHARGDLLRYWSLTDSPRTYNELSCFYSKLFNLGAALRSIHELSDQGDGQA